MRSPRLPRYRAGDDLVAYLDALAAAAERALAQTPQGRVYTVTNAVTQRALNVSTATASDDARVLGTLIGDLIAAGVIA